MDGMSSAITEILNNPAMMERIRGLASMLGQSSSDPQDTSSATNTSPSGFPQSAFSQFMPQQTPTGAENFPTELTGLMMRLMPAIGSFQQETDETRFLAALRPLLREERRSKLDGAVRLLKIIRLLPLIRETGLF